MVKKVQYLVKGNIPENMLSFILGKPGNYKSWLMAHLAIAAANGEQLFDAFPCKVCHNIFYFDEDSPTDVYEQRLELFALGQIPPSINRRSMTGFRLIDDNVRVALCKEIRGSAANGQNVLVLLDCLSKIAVGLNLDRTTDAVKIMSYLAEIRDAGATVVVTHHISIHGSGKELMNNTQIAGGADSTIYLEAIPLKDRHLLKVNPKAKRVTLTDAFSVELTSDEDAEWATMLKMADNPVIPTDEEKRVFRLFPDVNEEWTVKEISDSTGRDLADSQIRIALTQLVMQGCLERVSKPHDRSHAAYYKLHPGYHQLNSVYKQLIK